MGTAFWLCAVLTVMGRCAQIWPQYTPAVGGVWGGLFLALLLRRRESSPQAAAAMQNVRKAQTLIRGMLVSRGVSGMSRPSLGNMDSLVDTVRHPMFAVVMLAIAATGLVVNLEASALACRDFSMAAWAGLSFEWVAWLMASQCVWLRVFGRG